MKCAVSRLSWTSKRRCPKVPLEIVQIASHVSSSPRRQETPRPRSTTPHPDTTPSPQRRRVLYIPHMEGSTLHPNQAIDIGARQRVHSPHVRCPRQPSARPAAAGVVVALQKIFWICSCNVPRPLQIECKTTSTAAMEGTPINRGPGSRQKAPVRDRLVGQALRGKLHWPPGPSTLAAHPDTTPSRKRRRILYIPHMEGSTLHPNQAIDIGARQRVRSPHDRCHQRRPSHPAGSRVPGLVQQ